MPTFAELLTKHIENAGITHTRLADAIGVRRQTVFRWKEGLTARPRYRDDVLACAKQLRLDHDETNELLLSAGFQPLKAPIASMIPILESTLEELEPVEIESSDDEGESNVENPIVENDKVAVVLADYNDSEHKITRNERRMWNHLFTWPWIILLPLCMLVIGTLVTLSSQPSPPPTITPLIPPTSTATPRPIPTVTPISTLVAGNETLILISKFIGQGYLVNRRVREALESEIKATKLMSTSVRLWTETVEDESRAQTILEATRATMLIRGEYDQGRVRVNLSIRGKDATLDWERLLNSPAELTPVINSDVADEARILALFSLGRLYRDEGDYDSAKRVFNQALALDPKEIDTEASLYFYLGYVSERGSAPDMPFAIQHYSDVLRLKPAWINARYNRGTAYRNLAYKMSSLDEAENFLDKAIEDLSKVLRAKETVPAFLNRGIAYYERQKAGDLTKAVADFDAAQHLKQDDYRIYFNRGLTHIRANDPRWIIDIMQALDLKPEYAPIYNALCWGYALDQALEEALPYCDQAIILGDTGNSRDGRGLVYAQQGRLAEAKIEFQAYLEWINTKYPDMYERYQGLLIETWITALETGKNPITPETLDELR